MKPRSKEYLQGWNDAQRKVERIGNKNNTNNASHTDEEGWEGLFITYKQLGETKRSYKKTKEKDDKN